MTAPFRIKCCGITRVEDLHAAAAAGFDAVGLVFAPRSPRRLELATAARLRAAAPAGLKVVALFMDQPADAVQAVVDAVRPDLLQFHGRETDAWCNRFGRPWLKAVGLAGDEPVALDAWPHARALLLDGHRVGAPGGQGRALAWSRLPTQVPGPWLLAGGLDPDNVGRAIARARPWGVDVSSGVESSPGCKDVARMERFVTAVRAHATELAGGEDD